MRSTEKFSKDHSFCNECLHNLLFIKTRSSSPNLSKLARADISCQFMKTRSFCRTVYKTSVAARIFFVPSYFVMTLVWGRATCTVRLISATDQTSQEENECTTTYEMLRAYFCNIYILWHIWYTR